MRKDRVTGRRVGVIGAARSGLAAAALLKRHRAEVFVSDSRPSSALEDAVSFLESNGIAFETGGNTDRVYTGVDYVVISPGVPPDAPVVKRIEEARIPLISEIELGYWLCDAHIAAVTGSNGKTTTTSLTGEVFKCAGVPTFVAGNIGSPFCDICDKASVDGWVILEVSSAQLEKCYDFKPDIAAILNLTPDHLDRYDDFTAYAEMKMRIGESQSDDDSLVINYDDEYLMQLSSRLPGRKLHFSTRERVSPGVFVEGNSLMYGDEDGTRELIETSDIRLKGPHNLSNSAASAMIAVIAGIGDDAIRDALSQFGGVEHRLEDCGRIGQVGFINDSKATNVDSVWYALQSIPGSLVVIMGGRDKMGDFTRLEDLMRRNVRAIILLGEASDKIDAALGGVVPVYRVREMEEAVRTGYRLAEPDGTLLLSPACASFDMFDDFEHRGRAFKEAVDELRREFQ